MKDSVWGYFTIAFGIIVIVIIFFMQRVTTYDQHDYAILRETTEAAMYASLDMDALNNNNNEIKIDEEKFRLNFIKKFADNASLSKKYKIEIYDINSNPPKVSLKITSKTSGYLGIKDFQIVNKVDAILEAKK